MNSYKKLLTVLPHGSVRNRASGAVLNWGWQYASSVHARITVIFAAHSPFGGVSITVELPLDRLQKRYDWCH